MNETEDPKLWEVIPGHPIKRRHLKYLEFVYRHHGSVKWGNGKVNWFIHEVDRARQLIRFVDEHGKVFEYEYTGIIEEEASDANIRDTYLALMEKFREVVRDPTAVMLLRERLDDLRDAANERDARDQAAAMLAFEKLQQQYRDRGEVPPTKMNVTATPAPRKPKTQFRFSEQELLRALGMANG
jgi:hypothetical protein